MKMSFCLKFLSNVVPAPISVILTSSTPNPVQPIGSMVNLTCIVHITDAVDISVTLTTIWIGPDEFITISTLQPILENSTTYTSRAVISSFGRNESGNYTCTAGLSSVSTNLYLTNSSTTTSSIQVTTGEICMENCTNLT